MNNNFRRTIRRFIRYMQNTYKNKLAAIAMILTSWWIAKATGEGTFLLLMLIIGITVFFMRFDVFYNPKD